MHQLTALPIAAVLGSVLEDLAVVFALVLGVHFLLDLFFLRRRRRSRELAVREHQLAAVAELSSALALADDKESIARTVLDTLNELVGFDFSGLVLIDADGSEGRGLVARAEGFDVSWYPLLRLDLENEVSGVGHAIRTHAIFTVEDAPGSTEVSAELTENAGLKSMVFLPLESELGVVVVVTAGSTS